MNTERESRRVSRLGPIHLRPEVRALAVLVMLVVTSLGSVVELAHVQRDAVTAIVKAGGTVKYNGPAGADTRNREERWPPWLVAYIGVDYFYSVVKVNISGGRGSDAEMAHIGHLHHLQELSAHSVDVTDVGIAHLERLKNLQVLYLDRTSITSGGLVHLERLSDLSLLGLRNNPQIDGSALLHLTGLTKLRWLLLDGSGVSDAGVAHLQCMTGLEFLDVTHTGVSAAGAGRLQRALPKALVRHWTTIPRVRGISVRPGADRTKQGAEPGTGDVNGDAIR
jgi:hypothetical protein